MRFTSALIAIFTTQPSIINAASHKPSGWLPRIERISANTSYRVTPLHHRDHRPRITLGPNSKPYSKRNPSLASSSISIRFNRKAGFSSPVKLTVSWCPAGCIAKGLDMAPLNWRLPNLLYPVVIRDQPTADHQKRYMAAGSAACGFVWPIPEPHHLHSSATAETKALQP